MLQGIFFDIDDTLYSTTAFAERARRASIEQLIRMGLDIDPEDGYQELVEVIREFSSNYGGHYGKFLNRQPESALRGKHHGLLIAGAVVAYHETKFRHLKAFDDVLETMKLLATGTDLVLGIITSGLRIKQSEKLVRLGVWPFLDQKAIFITDEVGIGKPNPKLYRRACDAMDLDPAKVMYVGDNPVNDVHPANQTGMVSVWNKRKGRHIDLPCISEPDHVIRDFNELRQLLFDVYDIDPVVMQD